jgi:hypothetical protein
MSRLVRVSGNIVLALVVAGALYAGYVVFRTNRDHADAAAFISAAVSAMATSWDSQELARRAAPEWLSATELAGLPAVFSNISRLGKLKALQVPTGRVGNGAYPGTGINGVWAEYTVAGDFDAGPSSFRMILKRVDDGWQITGFEVLSSVLTRAN